MLLKLCPSALSTETRHIGSDGDSETFAEPERTKKMQCTRLRILQTDVTSLATVRYLDSEKELTRFTYF